MPPAFPLGWESNWSRRRWCQRSRRTHVVSRGPSCGRRVTQPGRVALAGEKGDERGGGLSAPAQPRVLKPPRASNAGWEPTGARAQERRPWTGAAIGAGVYRPRAAPRRPQTQKLAFTPEEAAAGTAPSCIGNWGNLGSGSNKGAPRRETLSELRPRAAPLPRTPLTTRTEEGAGIGWGGACRRMRGGPGWGGASCAVQFFPSAASRQDLGVSLRVALVPG